MAKAFPAEVIAQAVGVVNQIKDHVTYLAREIVNDAADHVLTRQERLQLRMREMELATTILALLEEQDALLQQAILYVLEHGHYVCAGSD